MSRLAASVLGAGITASVGQILRSALPRSARWTRTNYAGREVSLAGGLSTAAGAVAAASGAGGAAGTSAALVTASAGVLGAVDDQTVDAAADKGLRGHLRALAGGRLTSGGAKLLGISAAALLAAALGTGAGRRGRDEVPGRVVRGIDVLSGAALIAGTANLLNLFDLRPGRALKVAGLLSLPPALSRGPGVALATGAVAVAAASAPADLAGETMLGDAGANALGALVGTAWALHPDSRLRGCALAGVLTLTVLSEKVSFTRVIEATPPLRALDTWGRSG